MKINFSKIKATKLDINNPKVKEILENTKKALEECKANLIGAECITNCECIQYAKLIQPKEENLSNNEYLLKAFEDSERELKQKETTTWDDIFEQHWEECEHNHMANFQDWLKEHYNVPIKKNNYDTRR